jgi:hypothetical protein
MVVIVVVVVKKPLPVPGLILKIDCSRFNDGYTDFEYIVAAQYLHHAVSLTKWTKINH